MLRNLREIVLLWALCAFLTVYLTNISYVSGPTIETLAISGVLWIVAVVCVIRALALEAKWLAVGMGLATALAALSVAFFAVRI